MLGQRDVSGEQLPHAYPDFAVLGVFVLITQLLVQGSNNQRVLGQYQQLRCAVGVNSDLFLDETLHQFVNYLTERDPCKVRLDILLSKKRFFALLQHLGDLFYHGEFFLVHRHFRQQRIIIHRMSLIKTSNIASSPHFTLFLSLFTTTQLLSIGDCFDLLFVQLLQSLSVKLKLLV